MVHLKRPSTPILAGDSATITIMATQPNTGGTGSTWATSVLGVVA